MFLCPLCGERLTQAGTACICPHGHSFDVAREGYVNLLVGGVRGAAGDTREMLRARRAFLAGGYYAPLAEQVCALALAQPAVETAPGWPLATKSACVVSPSPQPSPLAAPVSLVMDAGCGEGYYLGRLRQALDARFGEGAVTYLGVDIAKEAVQLATRRYRGICFAVADVKRRIPVAGSCVALLLSIFAPRNADEFARVVAPGGMLLVAIPGPRHLYELRERYGLLGIEPEKERSIRERLAGCFVAAGTTALEYPMDLDGDAVRQLLSMSPNARHRERQGWQDTTCEPARVTASFVVLAFRRT